MATVILFLLAVDNAYEFFLTYKVHKGKANMMDIHSRVVEAGELLGYILAGILLFLSMLNIIIVTVVIVIGLFHLGGALTSKQQLSQFSQKSMSRLNMGIMALTLLEVVVAGSILGWMATNGWIGV